MLICITFEFCIFHIGVCDAAVINLKRKFGVSQSIQHQFQSQRQGSFKADLKHPQRIPEIPRKKRKKRKKFIASTV